MEKVRPPKWTGWPVQAALGKDYSYPKVRDWLERRGIEAVIPQRSDQIWYGRRMRLDRQTYRRRVRVENSVACLKENQFVGTRYDKLASSLMAFINLGITRRYLHILAQDEPTERT